MFISIEVDIRWAQPFAHRIVMCSISYFVIKRQSANDSWRPSSKTAKKWATNADLLGPNQHGLAM